ncbi:UNVERIFIED_CONTAM: hypothetical protein PYX00_003893 [Menopon gallinae]|uniref:CWH43-like N-terminal domain-containing protein n=1 Tax=Menopon gallinae TaxID=328185 RepID=A0AAW2I2B9_9NEOP
MWNVCHHVHWLPLLLFAVLATTFIITYSIAVSQKHVYAFWPYISDTGALPPESCVFSLLLNIASMITMVIIYIRHVQVSEYTRLRSYINIHRGWNITSSVIAYMGILGLLFVANFQETNQFAIHIIGAIMCFVLITIYFLIQCVFTYKMQCASKLIFWLRVLFTCINAISFIMTFSPIGEAIKRHKGKNKLYWTPKDGGYEYHLISTISEWILVLSFCLYVSTFYWEFKKFHFMPCEMRVRVRRYSDFLRVLFSF